MVGLTSNKKVPRDLGTLSQLASMEAEAIDSDFDSSREVLLRHDEEHKAV